MGRFPGKHRSMPSNRTAPSSRGVPDNSDDAAPGRRSKSTTLGGRLAKTRTSGTLPKADRTDGHTRGVITRPDHISASLGVSRRDVAKNICIFNQNYVAPFNTGTGVL